MTKDDSTNRKAALDLLKRGEANLSDVARLAGVERQLVYYWAKVAGINPNETRESRLKTLWRQAVKRA